MHTPLNSLFSVVQRRGASTPRSATGAVVRSAPPAFPARRLGVLQTPKRFNGTWGNSNMMWHLSTYPVSLSQGCFCAVTQRGFGVLVVHCARLDSDNLPLTLTPSLPLLLQVPLGAAFTCGPHQG